MARTTFGFAELRPTQRAALAPVLAGRDTLAVLATGAGKSAIYQLAGLALGGLTVVVSPLVALQRDQLRGLSQRRRPDGRAIASGQLNAAQPTRERRETEAALRAGELDFILLGPEQLTRSATRALLAQSSRPTMLLAVDEAHLVSEWGFDFRPDYLQLADVRHLLGNPQTLALTATAAPPVQTEITRRLGMRDPAVVVAGFDRPGIRLGVHVHHARARRDQDVTDDLVVREVIDGPTPALVYAGTRQHCEALARRLSEVALRAAAYHAGLAPHERSAVQDAFLAGNLDAVVATSAFGMGIDKPDVRTVIHASPPGSLDEYYQEVGRAGRDGKPARALLVFNPLDLRLPRLFAASSRLRDVDVQAVVAAAVQLERTDAMEADGPVRRIALNQLAEAAGVSRRRAERVVERLADAGSAELHGDTVVLRLDEHQDDAGPLAAANVVHDAEARRQAVAASRIEAVRHYAETSGCRRAELLAYFGEHYEPPCGNCDNDRRTGATSAVGQPARAGSAHATAAETTRLPAVGATVQHRLWGHGTVLSADPHELVVAFDSVGYKHLTPAVLGSVLRVESSAR
ncbi:MAG TPA: RecQ family ATP-dependent DNA helicase [Jatrophihabitans sp.]|nr:RecQ family ATP-dependent DNA helicase [Jatrophihabitans sp.]